MRLMVSGYIFTLTLRNAAPTHGAAVPGPLFLRSTEGSSETWTRTVKFITSVIFLLINQIKKYHIILIKYIFGVNAKIS